MESLPPRPLLRSPPCSPWPLPLCPASLRHPPWRLRFCPANFHNLPWRPHNRGSLRHAHLPDSHRACPRDKLLTELQFLCCWIPQLTRFFDAHWGGHIEKRTHDMPEQMAVLGRCDRMGGPRKTHVLPVGIRKLPKEIEQVRLVAMPSNSPRMTSTGACTLSGSTNGRFAVMSRYVPVGT